MSPLIPPTHDAEFARMLMAEIPWGILIVDESGRYRPVNDILRRTFGLAEDIDVRPETMETRGNGRSSPGSGRGESAPPEVEEARQLGLRAIRENRPLRSRKRVALRVNQRRRDAAVLMTAVPLSHAGRRLAAVFFQDVSDLKRIAGDSCKEGFRGLIGRETVMQNLFDTIRKVAPTPAPVLIQGESGTGKELVAQAIHQESPRAEAHFVPFNCGALPDGLIESELFGHVKGAFTGAIRDKKGRFELASGGTIFLDEIGELKRELQVKLLRVLESGRLERVGGEKTIPIDVRVISATNRNLEREVAEKRFREDLYYRLCVMPVSTPALRERPGDIPLLARYFLSRFSRENGFGPAAATDAALQLLSDHPWPGNVRELQNALQYALVQSRGMPIEPEHLPASVRRGEKSPRYAVQKRDGGLTRNQVRRALEEVAGNKKRAAEILGVSRSTLYRFLSRNP
ncbi:MAG: sigma-54 interaction domain-containing protein [Desulfococcaceae bacterium]